MISSAYPPIRPASQTRSSWLCPAVTCAKISAPPSGFTIENRLESASRNCWMAASTLMLRRSCFVAHGMRRPFMACACRISADGTMRAPDGRNASAPSAIPHLPPKGACLRRTRASRDIAAKKPLTRRGRRHEHPGGGEAAGALHLLHRDRAVELLGGVDHVQPAKGNDRPVPSPSQAAAVRIVGPARDRRGGRAPRPSPQGKTRLSRISRFSCERL